MTHCSTVNTETLRSTQHIYTILPLDFRGRQRKLEFMQFTLIRVKRWIKIVISCKEIQMKTAMDTVTPLLENTWSQLGNATSAVSW